MDNSSNATQVELTFVQKAVGLTFNPANNLDVQSIKGLFAATIDKCNDLRSVEGVNPEVARMLSKAITDAQTAQMWAVKAVTWQA